MTEINPRDMDYLEGDDIVAVELTYAQALFLLVYFERLLTNSKDIMWDKNISESPEDVWADLSELSGAMRNIKSGMNKAQMNAHRAARETDD